MGMNIMYGNNISKNYLDNADQNEYKLRTAEEALRFVFRKTGKVYYMDVCNLLGIQIRPEEMAIYWDKDGIHNHPNYRDEEDRVTFDLGLDWAIKDYRKRVEKCGNDGTQEVYILRPQVTIYKV